MSTSVNTVKTTKRTTKKQQKKAAIADVKEVVPEVVIDNGFTESMKEEDKKEEIKQVVETQNKETVEKEKVDGGCVKVKKPVPIIFVKRNELSNFIVKESGFKGFRAPINKLISWIIDNNEPIKSKANKESKIEDKIAQLEEVKKYFIDHKDDCIKQIDTFKPVKKEKETIEPGHYFIIYKKEDKYSYSCVKDTAIKGNLRKHADFEHVQTKKVCDDFDIKTKKEQFKDVVDFCGRNSFKIKDGKDIKDFIELII